MRLKCNIVRNYHYTKANMEKGNAFWKVKHTLIYPINKRQGSNIYLFLSYDPRTLYATFVSKKKVKRALYVPFTRRKRTFLDFK